METDIIPAPIDVHAYDGILASEMTEHERADILISSQHRSLEMIVTGSPLASVLSYLARVVEMQSDSRAIASILLLDEDGNLRNGASPSLPDDYIEAINGLKPCLNLGTCCSAAPTGQVVVTPDIETDPNWAALKHLPLGPGAPSGAYYYNRITIMNEMKAWFFLVASVALLLVICGLATLGLLTRPVRWEAKDHSLRVALPIVVVILSYLLLISCSTRAAICY